MENQIREIRDERSGRLRLGISVSRGIQVLPLVLPAFAREYPHVKVELVEGGSGLLDAMVRQGRIDLALAAMESTGDNMTYELIEEETIGILAGKDAPIARRLADGTPVTIEDANKIKYLI